MTAPLVTRSQTDCDAIDYTPSGAAVNPGDVVVSGDIIGIVPSGRMAAGIEDGELGALQLDAGPWICPKATGGGTALTLGQVVFWDAGNSRVDGTGTVGKAFGVVVKAAATTDATVLVRKFEDGGRKQAAVVAALTDNSGGAAADGTIGVITVNALTAASPGAGADGTTPSGAQWAAAVVDLGMLRTAVIANKDAVKELATEVNAILTALKAAGLMANA